jgi:AcrR family transcriptional regulator
MMRKKSAYHHGNLRETLLAQAMRSLEREGLEGLSLRSLAQAAGVSKTAPYRHFADKRELLVALAAEGFARLADTLEAGLAAPSADGPEGPAAGMRSLSQAYIGFARANPALYRLMFSRLGYSLHSESCRVNSSRAFACLMAAVERAQAAGWRPTQEHRALALSVWAGVHGWAGLLNDGLIREDLLGGSEEWGRFGEELLL